MLSIPSKKRNPMLSFIHQLLIFIFSITYSFSSCAIENTSPKNIILFIGDGMGVSQISAAKIVKGSLNLEQFPVSGLLSTHSADSLITDSAAAGTALATGYKTNNGMISQLPSGKAVKTIVEYAIENNMATGIVVSSSITHATPAAFIAHIDSRKKHNEIAEQIAKSQVDLLFGGGLSYFLAKENSTSLRTDNKNLITELKKYRKVLQTEQDFLDFNSSDPVIGLFAPIHPGKAGIRKPDLAQLTRKAIELLSTNDKNGFFLMVEGSQIDWAGHQNDQIYMLNEMLDFDNALGIALNYAKQDPQTLIIATSDHETGGFAIHDGSFEKKQISHSTFASTHHTATMVPIFSYGPGSTIFSGIHDNTYVGKNLIEYMTKPSIK